MKKILVLVPGYLPGFKSGGPVRTVANMIEALSDEISFSVVCLDRDLGDKESYTSIDKNTWNRQGQANVFYVERGPRCLPKLLSILRSHNFTAIHLNSFFSFQFSILPLILLKALRIKAPVILGPRGEFSQGALSLKSIKKQLFISISKLAGIYKNIIWHASSPHEENDIRRIMGQTTKIRVATDISSSTSDIKIPTRNSNQPLKVAFIARISPMKNLHYAISVLKEITAPLIFDIYGPLEDKTYWEICAHAAKSLPENINFNYLGPLQPEFVIQRLSEYDLFLLPTLGENFGHIIAEAFFAGLPVLISDQTPWRQLSESGIGWDIPLNDKKSFTSAIKHCSDLSSDEYHDWRTHIRNWALTNIGNKEAIDATRQLFAIN